MDVKQKLIAKIKLIHKIPPEDELPAENEVFLDYFATELLKWIGENKEELNGEESDSRDVPV